MSTRRNTSRANKPAPPANTPPGRRVEAAATPTPNTNPVSDDAELADLVASLPKESKALVKILKSVFAKQLKEEMDVLREEISRKDRIIEALDKEVKDLKSEVHMTFNHILTVSSNTNVATHS